MCALLFQVQTVKFQIQGQSFHDPSSTLETVYACELFFFGKGQSAIGKLLEAVLLVQRRRAWLPLAARQGVTLFALATAI